MITGPRRGDTPGIDNEPGQGDMAHRPGPSAIALERDKKESSMWSVVVRTAHHAAEPRIPRSDVREAWLNQLRRQKHSQPLTGLEPVTLGLKVPRNSQLCYRGESLY
jgi:hypothetical protein